MARSQANLQPTILEGLAGTTPMEKLLYIALLVEPTVNHAGVGAVRVSRWAKEMEVLIADVEKALLGLDEKRYALVDHDTEEILVRTLIRNDGVAKQPNVLRGALREAVLTRSPRLRHAIALELRRLPPKPADQELKSGKMFVHPDPHACADRLDPPPTGGGRTAVDNPPGNPSGTLPEGFDSEGFPNPSRTLGGGGGGGGSTSSWVGGSVGEARESRGPAPQPSTAGHTDPPADGRVLAFPDRLPAEPPRCPRRHAVDKPCRRCKTLREQWEADVARAERTAQRARQQHAQALRDDCAACDEAGWVLTTNEHGERVPAEPARRCDHRADLRAVGS